LLLALTAGALHVKQQPLRGYHVGVCRVGTHHCGGNAAGVRLPEIDWDALAMNALLWIVGILAVILLVVGGINTALSWLLWVGLVILLLTIIAWILFILNGRRSHAA
jgi:hypothetical protein